MTFQKLTSEELRKHKGISYPGVTTSFLCYDSSGRVFQAKRSKHSRDEQGSWEFGGGGLKHGQTLINNLTRELKEEFNFKPLKLDFIGHFEMFRESNGIKTHWLAMGFAVLVDPEELNINEPEMFDDHGWFTLETLPSPQHSVTHLYLEQYGEKIRNIIAGGSKTKKA